MQSRPLWLPPRARAALGAAVVFSALTLPAQATIRSGDWTGDFSIPAFDGHAYAGAILNGQYYVAGNFHWAGAVPVQNVARWNGSAWTPVAGGLPFPVSRLAVRGTELLAATSSGFPSNGPVMRFDGAWAALGSNLSGEARALLVNGEDVYAAGYLDIDDNAMNRVVRWDGAEWQPVGGAFDGGIQALAVYQGELYAGGDFGNVEGQPASRIARWDGAHWQPVGGGTDDRIGDAVSAFAVYGGRLIVGGSFTSLGGLPIHGIGAWNGATWDSLPETPRDAFVSDLEPDGNTLYIAGLFQVPNQWSAGLVMFDGQHWLLPDPYPGWRMSDLATENGAMISVGDASDLYGAGARLSQMPMRNVIVRDPTWRPLFAWKPGMRGLLGPGWTAVSALHAYQGSLLAGGYFEYAPGTDRWDYTGSLVRWTGDGWRPVGNLRGWVDRIASYGDRIVVGGSGFHSSNGTYTSVLVWDGQNWGDLGGPLEGAVFALTEWQGNLVAGGGVRLPGQPIWSGVAIHRSPGWTILGNLPVGGNSIVRDLATFGGELYAAGTNLGSSGTSRGLLRWNGKQWTPVPGAPDSPAACLLTRADGLWVGFSWGSSSVGSIWRWDGAHWTQMGDLSGNTSALGEAGGEVIAAGQLIHPLNGWISMARWTGTEWNPIPGGPDQSIQSMAAVGNDLYVGGAFQRTALQQSEGLARWSFVPEVILPSIPSIETRPSPVRDQITFRLSATSAARAVVEIYDLHGARIATPVDESIPAGDTERSWAIPRSRMPAGVYFARVRIGSTTWGRRIVLVP